MGLLPQPERQGRRWAHLEEDVKALLPDTDTGRWDDASLLESAFVVRMGPPKLEEAEWETRKFIGLAIGAYPGESPEDSEKHRREAVSRWWPAKNPSVLKGLPIVATVAGGYVGAVYRIDPDEEPERMLGRVAFKLIDCDPKTASKYLGHKLKLPPGPQAYSLPRSA